MIKFLKKITAPTIFSKGLSQYNQRQYGIAKQLLAKAIQWMPSYRSDALYCAVSSLCDYHLSDDPAVGIDQFDSLHENLLQSPHRDTSNYTAIASEIKSILYSATVK